MTTRRAYLAGLPALALAGCLTDERRGETPADEGTNDGQGTPTDDEASDGRKGTATAGDATPEPPDSIDAEWPMPAHDAGRSNFATSTDGPTNPPEELWSVGTDAALSGPVLADGTLYVGGGDGTVRALDARTGAERWRASVDSPTRTPWVLDGQVVVPADDEVIALAAADGATEWRVETPDHAGFLLADHGIYYVSEAGPTLVALDGADGSERWRAELDDPWELPLLAVDGRVIVPSGAYDSLPWVFDAATGEYLGDRRPRSGADFAAERFALNGGVYAADAFFGNVRADAVGEDGYGRRWRAGVDAYGGFAMAGGAEHLFLVAEAGDEPGLHALSLAGGEEVWHTDAATGIVGRPVAARDALLVRTEDRLHCLDPTDGTERWTHPGDEVGRQFVVVDDLVYATGDGTVRALRATE